MHIRIVHRSALSDRPAHAAADPASDAPSSPFHLISNARPLSVLGAYLAIVVWTGALWPAFREDVLNLLRAAVLYSIATR